MHRARTFLPLALLCLSAAAAVAQEWRGPAAIALEVKGKPRGSVGEALVILRYQQMEPPGGPRPVVTDAAGRAVLVDLAEGVWEVEVSHDDFLSFVASVVLQSGKKPVLQASFLQASGSSLTPIRVRFLKGDGKAPSASVPLPPEAAARLAQRRPPAAPPPPAVTPPPAARPAPRRARAPEPQLPEPELRPLPESAQTAEAPSPPPAPPPVPAAKAPAAEPPAAEPPPAGPPPAGPPPGELSVAELPVAELPVAEPPVAEPPPAAPAAPQLATAPAATPELPAPEPPTPEPPTPEPPAPEPPAPEPPAPEPPAPEPPAPEPPAPEPPAIEAPAPEPAAPAPPPTMEPAPAAPVPAPAAETSAPAAVEAPIPTAEVLSAPGPLGPTLRAYRDRSCVECRPGEWAISVEVVAGPPSAPCDDSLEADGGELAALLGGSIALELKEVAAPAAQALAAIDPADAARAADLLGDDSRSCRIVAAVIPKAGRFRGARLEAADASGVGDCQADRACPVGRARWVGQPRVAREPSANVIWGLFVNEAPERERRARLTVYFAAPYRAWEPPG